MNKRIILTFFILFSLHDQSCSQGCSDAGFCTMGSLNPTVPEDASFKHLGKLSFGVGSGEQRTTHVDVFPEFEFSFVKNNSLRIKVPFLIVSGNLGSNHGLGDVSVSSDQAFSINGMSPIGVTVGIKLPTGTTAKYKDARALPMPYQTGLGTLDLILGVSYQYSKWKISGGYQKVLHHGNENHFLHSRNNNDLEIKYFESNALTRGDDALIRMDRNFSWHHTKLFAGLLAIYRLQKDKIMNESDQEVTLKSSDGLTLNITGGVDYLLSDHGGLSIIFGTPVVVRKVRADGLTREFVLTAAYQYRFGK